jgi:hypothetical protein
MGFLAYPILLLVKFFGYSLAGRVLNRAYSSTAHSAWKIGGIRTLIGVVVGGVFTGIWILLDGMGVFQNLGWNMGRIGSSVFYLAALFPIRIGEWFFTIWYFYDRSREKLGKDILFTFIGIIWSYALDLPVILGLILVVSSIC